MHARMQAKIYKILSQHHLLSSGRLRFKSNPFWFRRRYDLSIWIDGSLQIKSSSFVRDMRQYVYDAPWAMFSHPDRDCIYDEAVVSAAMRKYRNLPLFEQVESYRSAVPPHSGLYACTIIVRKEPIPAELSDVNRRWYQENLKWTYQDQLSLPYVLRNTDSLLHPARIKESLWHNQWFNFLPHRHDG